MDALLLRVDPFLIPFFRLSEIPIAGFLVGTVFLALCCVVIGQVTIFVSFCVNQDRIAGQNREMVRNQNLSVYALLAGNKAAWRALNSQANDAFGKMFFTQIALGASSLWPVPFALAWMQLRFGEVALALPLPLPGVGATVGYAFVFIPTFVLMHILFGKVKHRLPLFRTISRRVEAVTRDAEPLVSLAEAAAAGPARPS